ncbi:hypothetical protein GGI21_004437 [Coemansia aciculifera]|nr:hypothetical protein GGI21_004437 [Coemansia aciculifera]
MDQHTAQALFAQGGSLVILDAPQGIEFGVVVRKWCKDTEQVVDSVSAVDVERIRLGLRDLDSGLGAYPLQSAVSGESTYQKWRMLTCYITPDILQRVLPAGGAFSSATGSVYEDDEMEAARRMLEQKTGLPVPPTAEKLANELMDRFEFPRIDVRHSVPPQLADPSLVCRYGVDKSWLLKSLMARYWHSDAKGLLGEFQLSFLIILVGQNFAGLEHWKRLLHLVLGSEEALKDLVLVESLFVPMLVSLGTQLAECPKEFGSSVLDQDNFLAHVLTTFVLSVYESEEGQGKQVLEAQLDQIRLTLAARFQWALPSGKQTQDDADVEEGEYAPQIV